MNRSTFTMLAIGFALVGSTVAQTAQATPGAPGNSGCSRSIFSGNNPGLHLGQNCNNGNNGLHLGQICHPKPPCDPKPPCTTGNGGGVWTGGGDPGHCNIKCIPGLGGLGHVTGTNTNNNGNTNGNTNNNALNSTNNNNLNNTNNITNTNANTNANTNTQTSTNTNGNSIGINLIQGLPDVTAVPGI